jgi:aryl-alcohol dehydrogenase-like predicted oxidoreductase
MRTRPFGRLGWPVSEIGFGAWQIGGGQWGAVAAERGRAALHAALEAGITFLDTALAYGDGQSERLVGEVVREAGVRDRVRIATKVPPLDRRWPARPEVPLEEVFPRAWIRSCAERSLAHLDCGPIDLLQLHVWTDAWLDGWALDELDALRTEEKIRAVGISLSEHDPDSGLAAVASGRVAAAQVIYNVFDRSPERALFPAAAEAGVAVIARVPLDEGSLTGTLRPDTRFREDFRTRYFRGDRLAETVARVERLRPLLARPGQTLAQGALRAVLAHPAVSTVIVGSANPAHVAENAAASALGPLPPEELAALAPHVWPRNFYE